MAEGETSVEDVLPVLRKRFPGLEIFGLGDTQSIVALPFEAAGIVFANLAENAAQHGASRLELVVAAGARNATILVRDNGSGISEGNRERVFQPFFSTRREQGGTGMGLDIVRTMLGSYGGTIHLRQAAGAATEFEIIVPLTS
jgi:signal transduction histidine kinase